MKVIGTSLNHQAKQEALSMFVHRFTREHIPQWSKKPMPNGNAYPVQFDSDNDWLAHTYFEVTKSGNLSKRNNYCESNPTFPDNPEFRQQYLQ